jgi:hypothetical protein
VQVATGPTATLGTATTARRRDLGRLVVDGGVRRLLDGLARRGVGLLRISIRHLAPFTPGPVHW